MTPSVTIKETKESLSFYISELEQAKGIAKDLRARNIAYKSFKTRGEKVQDQVFMFDTPKYKFDLEPTEQAIEYLNSIWDTQFQYAQDKDIGDLEAER